LPQPKNGPAHNICSISPLDQDRDEARAPEPERIGSKVAEAKERAAGYRSNSSKGSFVDDGQLLGVLLENRKTPKFTGNPVHRG
jgi:hypothetical protein